MVELYLFTVDPILARRAGAASVDGFVVDWERRGKLDRQRGADTEINAHTEADLHRLRAATTHRILCRVNAFGDHTASELEAAIGGGADEVLLPMVRTVAEVEAALEIVAGRAGLGILIETTDAVVAARELSALPLSRVYLGLNDLAIERGSVTIFEALVDGTAAAMRDAFDVPFGVVGLTDPEGGAPLPCRLLVAELVRLGCAFTFLRRSFHRDLVGPRLEDGLSRIRQAVVVAEGRSPRDTERDRSELCVRVAALGALRPALVAIDG